MEVWRAPGATVATHPNFDKFMKILVHLSKLHIFFKMLMGGAPESPRIIDFGGLESAVGPRIRSPGVGRPHGGGRGPRI